MMTMTSDDDSVDDDQSHYDDDHYVAMWHVSVSVVGIQMSPTDSLSTRALALFVA